MRKRVGRSHLYVGLALLGLTTPTRAFAADEAVPPQPAPAAPAPAEQAPPPAPAPQPLPAPAPMVAPAPSPSVAIVIAPPPPPPTAPSFRIDLSKGNSLRIGLLLQPQFQSVNSAELDKYSNNLYLRRTRILLGGTILGSFEYFLDTDYPNLFLPPSATGANGASTLKATPGMNIQDAFATWRIYGDMVKLDAGYMLPPLFHNAVQGATSLYSWDYFTYAFQQGNVLGSSGNPVGRDLGVQARGLLVDGHLEYRVGLFQGMRDAPTTTEVGARNFFRFAARIQLNLLDAEPGFFYQGTYLGSRKILSVGGTVDLQDSYRLYGGDVFLDLPVEGLGVVTAQADLAHWDGNDFITALPKQTAIMSEAGVIFAPIQLGPIVRFEHLWLAGDNNDQTRYVAGVAYWPYGHNSNVKAFYSRVQEQGAAHGLNQFNVQWQLYFF